MEIRPRLPTITITSSSSSSSLSGMSSEAFALLLHQPTLLCRPDPCCGTSTSFAKFSPASKKGGVGKWVSSLSRCREPLSFLNPHPSSRHKKGTGLAKFWPEQDARSVKSWVVWCEPEVYRRRRPSSVSGNILTPHYLVTAHTHLLTTIWAQSGVLDGKSFP